eukprot:876169-Prymnesium_polylepis.1
MARRGSRLPPQGVTTRACCRLNDARTSQGGLIRGGGDSSHSPVGTFRRYIPGTLHVGCLEARKPGSLSPDCSPGGRSRARAPRSSSWS